MPIAGVLGYVVIFEFGEDSWVVVDELTPPNVSIGCKGNSYSVQPAPQLTLVRRRSLHVEGTFRLCVVR
jgi:hypothetical protein